MRHITTGLILASSLLAVPSVVLAQASVASAPGVVSRGEGVIKRAPDRAWLSVSTEVRDGKAPDARTRSAQIVTTLTAALKGVGLADDAIRTTGYSLTPEMDWNNGRGTVRGYVVRNTLEVRVDDLDKLSDVIDTANSPKNAALSINGPRFDLKNLVAAEQEAVKAAVESAMRRAEAMAAGARRSLGPIIRVELEHVSPSTPGPRPMMAERAMMSDKAVETPITPGEIEIRASVVVTVAIQ